MPLNPLGVLDLSIVTELLIQTITTAWTESPLWETLVSEAFFTPTISGLTPDAVREGDGCQLTVSLIHIEPNRSQRNFVYPQIPPGVTNPPSPRAQTIPALPLGLDLSYFVSAFSTDPNNASVQEQQAISIVLKCFRVRCFNRVHRIGFLHRDGDGTFAARSDRGKIEGAGQSRYGFRHVCRRSRREGPPRRRVRECGNRRACAY